jgi:carbonic anhydrase/acetyltransferase-like protein (isoleucine patch superfamily)
MQTGAGRARPQTDGPRILPFDETEPDIADDAFVAPGATIVGRVRVGARSSVWYGTILRGDVADITIGEDTNIQDGSVGHADPGYPLRIGDRVTVGHRAVIHGCDIADDVLVGMGAVLMNGATVGRGSLIAAGAVVTQDTEIPPGSVVAGVPAKIRGEVGDAERELILGGAQHYVELGAQHRNLGA